MVSNAEALEEKATPSGEDMVKHVPGVGQMTTAFSDGFKLGTAVSEGDAQGIAESVNTIAGDIAGWGSDIASIVADPLQWLIQEGLSFLLDVLYPLKEMLELVTGDPDALSKAAEEFGKRGDELVKLGDEAQKVLDSGLQSWQGDAAKAAGGRMGKFCAGVRMIAGDAGNVAQVLQISSMFMQLAYDIILSIISSVVEWLVVTWVAALAAAGPTFGGSTAAAGAATPAEVSVATGKSGKEIAQAEKFLTKFDDLFEEISKNGKSASKLFTEGAGEAAKSGAKKGFKDAVGIPDANASGNDFAKSASTIAGHELGINKANQYGNEYPEGSDQEIDESLNF